jgi:hypothetical protein
LRCLALTAGGTLAVRVGVPRPPREWNVARKGAARRSFIAAARDERFSCKTVIARRLMTRSDNGS